MKYNLQCTPQESLSIVEQLIPIIEESYPYPLTHQISNLVMEGRYLEAIDFEIDYNWAFCSDDFIGARQVQALLSKQDFLDLGIDKEEVAFQKFLESEESCRKANERLNLNQPTSGVASVLHYAAENIDEILGDVPELCDLQFSFGPGATTSTKSATASPRAKMSDDLECSSNLVPRLGEFLSEFPLLSLAHTIKASFTSALRIVDVAVTQGKLAFVAKTCKTLRTIVVEPVLNGLGQKGIGRYMKDRLALVGVNLRDQTRNQKLAYQGSCDGKTATVDLKSASDCVCTALVWLLLSYDWACLLDTFRTPEVVYTHPKLGKVRFELEKFSSMGNAYTFELESLIFYSIAMGVCKHLHLPTCDVSVYGDDIIIPVAGYDLLEEVLNYCGFTFNKSKSFKEGPFRESCGTDYYKGIDIRPFYLKTKVSGRVLFNMHNFFFRNGDIKIARGIEAMIPEPLRIYGPDGYGDGHLLGEWHPRTSRKLKRSGYDGGIFDTYAANPKTVKGIRKGDYVYPSYSIYAPPDDMYDEREDFILPSTGQSSDMYRVRGVGSYSKMSIYTLTRCIFNRPSLKTQ